MNTFAIRDKTAAVRFDGRNRFYTTLWNLRNEVRAELKTPEVVVIRDVSLREGAQGLNLVYDPKQKLAFAKALDEVGVGEVDCGLTLTGEPDVDFIRVVKKANLKIQTVAYLSLEIQSQMAILDELEGAGSDIVTVSWLGGPIAGFAEERDYLQAVAKTIEGVKKRGMFCSFLAPITRWECEFAEKVYGSALSGGADRLEAGGAGLLGPVAFRFMVRWLKRIAGDKEMGIHSHNTLGTATANAFIGFEEGAGVIDTSVNGLGKSGGIAALDEVVVGLCCLYGCDLGLKLEELKGVSELMEKMAKIKVFPWKTILGDNSFIESNDANIEKVLKGERNWSDMGFLNPTAVGQKLRLSFGKSALGGKGIRAKAEEMGVTISAGDLQAILNGVGKMLENETALSEREIEKLIEKKGHIVENGLEA